jgi:transposase-like protein
MAVAPKNARPWSKGEKELAEYHLSRGKSTAEVGKLLGRTKNSVVSHSWRERGGDDHATTRVAPVAEPRRASEARQKPSAPRALSRKELGLDGE